MIKQEPKGTNTIATATTPKWHQSASKPVTLMVY